MSDDKARIEIDFDVNRDEATRDLQQIKQAREELGKAAVEAAKREAEAERLLLAEYQHRMRAQQDLFHGGGGSPGGAGGGFGRSAGGAHDADDGGLEFKRFGAVARRWHRRMTAIQSISGLGELAGGAIGGKGGAELGAGIGTLVQTGINMAASHFSSMAGRQNISNNASLSSWQKEQMLEEQLPVVGGLIRSMREFRQAMDGTTETLRSNQERFANIAADRSAQQSVESQGNAFRGRLSDAQNRLLGIGGASAIPQQLFDRSTSQGQVAYQQAQRLLPLQDAVAAAAREVQVARTNEAAARDRQAQGDRHLRSLGDGRLEAGNRLRSLSRRQAAFGHASFAESNFINRAAFGGSSWEGLRDHTAELDTTRRELAQISRDMASAAREQMTRSQASEAAGTSRIEAERRQHMAMADLNRGRLANLEQSESNMASQAGRFGAMTRMDRVRGLNAARQIRARGIQNVPHHLIEQARAFDPRFVEAEAQRAGENTAEYRTWQREFAPETERGSLGDIRNDIATQQDQVRNDVLNASTLTARSMVDLITRALAEYRNYVDQAVKAEHDSRIADQAVAHGNQGR